MYRLTILCAILLVIPENGAAENGPPLVLKSTVPLPKVDGRIDHFSADLAGHRIFMSALGNHTVEVIDALNSKLLKSIPDFDEPQGVLFDSASKRLCVASAGDGTVKILDATTFQLIKALKLGDDADNVRYNSRSGTIIVGYGSGALAILKADGTKSGEIALAGHPESFQLEKEGHRLFVNVPDTKEIAVVDLDKLSVVDHWRGWQTQRNFPMALDEKGHRLFAGFRTPAQILEIDTNSGKTVASADIVGDTDDLFYRCRERTSLRDRRRWVRRCAGCQRSGTFPATRPYRNRFRRPHRPVCDRVEPALHRGSEAH